MFAVWIPSWSIRWTSSIFFASSGSRADRLCSPSRRVSSSNWIGFAVVFGSAFQSWIRSFGRVSLMA